MKRLFCEKTASKVGLEQHSIAAVKDVLLWQLYTEQENNHEMIVKNRLLCGTAQQLYVEMEAPHSFFEEKSQLSNKIISSSSILRARKMINYNPLGRS